MKSRIIKISKNKIYFTNNDYVTLNQTNFPEGSISFKHHLDIYLETELSDYDKFKKTLEIEIINYSPQNINSFLEQELKKPINQLIFKKIDWKELKKLLSSFIVTLPNKIPEIFNEESLKNKEIQKGEPQEYPDIKQKKNINQQIIIAEPEVITREFDFDVRFSDARFYNSYVSVTKNFPFLDQPIEFKIFNELIRKEYNYIKSYFLNYFKSNTFTISAKIKTRGKELISFECQSKTIQNINEKIIENIKNIRTLNITKIEKNPEKEKNTYTADEIFSKIDKSSNVFEQSEFDILMTLIKSKSPRNVKQLTYLSGKKHEHTKKIRFTLYPLFGFIFFISGHDKNHFCWELLDSHATYVWSFNKELSTESQIELSELNINTIKKIGRKKYRSLIKNNDIDINSKFSVINHSKSKDLKSFEIWRNKLELILT